MFDLRQFVMLIREVVSSLSGINRASRGADVPLKRIRVDAGTEV